jgi:hypothetical protein
MKSSNKIRIVVQNYEMLNFAMALHHPSVLQFALLWFIKSIEKG